MVSENRFRIETEVKKLRTVCLSHDKPEEVWEDVLNKDREFINTFYTEMKKYLKSRVRWWGIISFLAKRYYDDIAQQDSRYIDECSFFAQQFNQLSKEEMTFLQIQTTIANYFPGGCTTVALFDEQAGNMVCMRSLDWGGADIIANVTRIFELQNISGQAVGRMAGVAGMVGALTAVKEGYSVVGNYAPGKLCKPLRECLRIDDPSFLMRKLIEDDSIKTYRQAVDSVKEWDVGAPFFITLCGIDRGEACTIEFGGEGEMYQRDAGENSLLIQTNHYLPGSDHAWRNKPQYPDKRYSSPERWYCSNLLRNSQKRLNMMAKGVEELPSFNKDLRAKLKELFRIPPVMNYESAHWAFMRPADASMAVTSLVDNNTCHPCSFLEKLFCKHSKPQSG